LPAFVRVTVWIRLSPTWTFPKLTLAGLAPSEPGVRPLPASETFRAPALLANAMRPLAFPLDCGANVTVRPALCPGDNVSGKVRPLRRNPVPVVVAWVTVKLVPPEFVMLAAWFWLLPTCTLPKLRLAGAAVRLPGFTPAPVTAIVRFEFAALEARAMLPVTAPADIGAKLTRKAAL